MIKTFALVAAGLGAVSASQFPEFAQQYTQRLAGQVDALTTVVMDFDTSALQAGLGREEALSQMVGSEFLTSRQNDMRRTFARHASLSNNLSTLRAASPIQRITMPHRFSDSETLAATWSDYQPAVPVTTAGAASAAIGGVAGWLAALAGLSLLKWPFKRAAQRPKPAAYQRREPTLQPKPPQQPRLVAERPMPLR